MSDKRRELYNKFIVVRRDGRSAPGEKHEDCQYFVLDLDHDRYAVEALRAYAESCFDDYPDLAADLLALSKFMEERFRRTPQQEGLKHT